MFSGTYHHNLDQKGRIIVPAKFREELSEGFILTMGLDGCLFMFPMTEWYNFRDRLQAIPLSSKDGRAFSRYFFANVVECELDKQGRLNIPQVLRDGANIKKEVVSIGVDSRIEIWDAEEWERYNASPDLDTEQIAEKMERLGI